jgi:hypothetical protein
MSATATSSTLYTAPTISVQRSSTEIGQNPTPSTGKSAGPSPSVDAQWSNNFWVTLSDPQVSDHWPLGILSFQFSFVQQC